MPEDSSKFPLVRCPKCGRLLPELPPYSVYRCGGCHGIFRAQKKSPLSDDLSGSSCEARHSEVSRVCKSPARKSPVREKESDSLDGHRNSPIREKVLNELDIQSKSSGRTADADDRKTQLREKGSGHGKSPAFSVRGGVVKAPVVGIHDARSAKEDFVADPEEIEARDRVDSRTRRTVDFGRRADKSGEGYGKLYGTRHIEVPYDDWTDEGLFGKPRTRVPHNAYDGSPNYRTELLRKYNKLHEKLIRIGDLISYSQDGQEDQGFASTDCIGADPDDYVYDEFSGLRTGTVKSAHQLPYYHHKYAARRSLDSIYNPRRISLHRPGCFCLDCHTSNLQDCMYRRWTLDPMFPNSTLNHSSQPRSSVESKLDGGSLAHDCRKKALVVNQNAQLCYPIAGGAPFVICCNCFQLLRIPGKIAAAKKNQFRLQCGSCLSVLSYDINAKGFTFPCKDSETSSELESGSSISAEATKMPAFSASSSQESKDDRSSKTAVSQSDASCEADKHSMNGLLPLRPPPGLISTEATKTSDFSASSSEESKDDHSSKTAVSQSDASSEADKSSMKGLLPLRPPPGSPLRDHKDYLYATKRSEERKSDTSNGDKGTVQRKRSVTFVENSAVSTESENSGEIQKTCTSQGSADASVRKDQGGYGNASDNSSATVIKRGFQDSSPQSLNTLLSKADVFVNGKPVTPDAVRRAEKTAGPISPGEYWYDSRAGFWGVMGDLCLGIIPPCIEEFSFQMAEDCSGGNTCVYVNGRELHKNDLDLLCSRGLPYTRFKYYVVDISGKVHDEDTGAFVVNLGKLAPTVESTGCGFGMHSPEALND